MFYVDVFAAGIGYAACLWLLAGRVARGRSIALGSLPVWTIALAGTAAVCVAGRYPSAIALPAGATLIGALICGLVDARTGYIFDVLTLSMVAATALAAGLNLHVAGGLPAAGIIGAALGALYLITGRRGIGLGDVKLGSAIAFGYGIGPALVTVGSAFVLGAAYGLALIAFGRAKRTNAVRFGPFMAGGAALGLTAFAWGPLW
jgi:leader peptidase (prepilin peptidase)/N-methyltransferase